MAIVLSPVKSKFYGELCDSNNQEFVKSGESIVSSAYIGGSVHHYGDYIDYTQHGGSAANEYVLCCFLPETVDLVIGAALSVYTNGTGSADVFALSNLESDSDRIRLTPALDISAAGPGIVTMEEISDKPLWLSVEGYKYIAVHNNAANNAAALKVRLSLAFR